MSVFVFLMIVFWVIVPRLREQERTRTATDAARRAQQRQQEESVSAAAQKLRQEPPRAAQYAYPSAAQRNAVRETPPEQEARYRAVRPKPEAPKPAPQTPKPADKQKVKSVLALIGGILGTGAAAGFGTGALAALMEFISGLVYGHFFAEELTAPIVLAALAVACGLGARKCFITRQRVKQYELYKMIIGEKRMCPVADIARASGRKPKKVLRELREMVRDGYFPLGFVDEETACFYADNDAYRAANPERARAQDAELAGSSAVEEPTREAQPQEEEATDALDEEELRALRREIAHVENAEIRDKAAKLARHAEDIFAWVKLHPECADDVRRFCSYYLPTAAKLLATYNEIAPHAGESSVAASVENEVSKVLDTMIAAYRELMDHLLQNTAVDMQAEISALETVLAQEGLTQSGLKL